MTELIRSNNQKGSTHTEIPVYADGSPIRIKERDILRIWAILKGRKWLILLVTLGVVAPVGLYSYLVTPTYLSTVQLQIEPESVKVLPYNAISDSLVRATPDFELYMRTQDVLLRSSTLASRTVSRLREAHPGVDPLPFVGRSFSSGLRIERVAGSQMVSLHYVSYDPEFSALAANTLAEEFIKLHFERKVDTTHKATSFLEGQLSELKGKVEVAEAELIQYAQRNSILDTSTNEQNVIRERFGLLSNEVARAQNTYLAIQAQYDELHRLTPESLPASLRDEVISGLEASILMGEQDLSRLLTRFGENWPEVIRKRNELEVLRQQLRNEQEAALDRVRREARFRLDTANANFTNLSKKFEEQQSLVHRLNESSILYNTLKRDLEASEQLYQGLLQRLKETGVSVGLEFGNIHLTDPASPNPNPYQPKPAWNLMLALFLGLSTGIVLTYFLDYVDPSLRDPTDLEALGIPVLGWIPKITKRSGKVISLEQSRRTRPLGLTNSELKETMALRPLFLAGWDPRARESYRALCASLLLSRAEKPAQTILVTSAIPREGKTTTAANLGITLAETGAATLLIDSDFRNPSLSDRFGVSNGKGLSVHLAGGEITILETREPNLFIVPAGPTPPNPVALFAANRFNYTLANLRSRFKFILIDSPPVLSLAETLMIASKVDGVIMVVKASDTPWELIARANTQLGRAGASVLGAAVNYLDLQNPEYSYFSKYYFDDRYGGNDFLGQTDPPSGMTSEES